MKIALVGYEANIPNRVGSNQYAFELIKALYRLDEKNQYVICLPNKPLPDLPKEKRNWHYQVVGPPKLWNVIGLPRALFSQKPKPDIIFNPGHYSPLFCPSPLVVTIMDLGYLRFPQQFTKPILFKLRFWTSWSIRRAAHILAISESTKDDIIKYYQVDPEKITVAYPGYDREKFKVQSSKFKINGTKKRYRIDGDYILFLGTLKPNKNIEGLLEAFKILISQYPKIRLVIAGRKGWLYRKVFERVQELDLTKRVIFTDFIDDEVVSVLMSGAKVFVLPSFWEGFGIPVVEAMACGIPVVVGQAGSLPEITGKAGVIVNPYKTEDIARGIKKAMESSEEFRRRGLMQAEIFDWKETARKAIDVFNQVGERK